MQIKPFRIEHYFAKHEFSARYLLASSDAESRSIQEVLDLEPGSHERFLKHCGYTESPGAPSLRATVAGIYQQIEPNQALNVSCAEEGILLAYHAWLKAGDHVWGANSTEQPEYLRVFIGQLRKKVEPDPAEPRYLLTERWVGYRFEPGV